MGILEKLGNWRMAIFLWVGLPFIAVIGLVFGAADLAPAWQAKQGNGTPGTFTAVREECRRGCEFHGDWRASDGSRTREDVILYDEPDGMGVGDSTEALDSGARGGVFATAGGWTYLLVTGLVVAGAAALVGWVFFLIRFFRRRAARRSEAEAPLTST